MRNILEIKLTLCHVSYQKHHRLADRLRLKKFA